MKITDKIEHFVEELKTPPIKEVISKTKKKRRDN
jgi:hypothetical protein